MHETATFSGGTASGGRAVQRTTRCTHQDTPANHRNRHHCRQRRQRRECRSEPPTQCRPLHRLLRPHTAAARTNQPSIESAALQHSDTYRLLLQRADNGAVRSRDALSLRVPISHPLQRRRRFWRPTTDQRRLASIAFGRVSSLLPLPLRRLALSRPARHDTNREF